jgi:glycerol uptake facilitator-like aquaporin
MVLVGVYHPQLSALEAKFAAAGLPANSLGGPGSILCSFPAATQTNYGYLFAIEFFVCTFIVSIMRHTIGTERTNLSQGIIIWAVLDPANPFISPQTAPFVIGFAYADMIWGFAGVTIATNTARDLGTRIVAAIFYGGGKHCHTVDSLSTHSYSLDGHVLGGSLPPVLEPY